MPYRSRQRLLIYAEQVIRAESLIAQSPPPHESYRFRESGHRVSSASDSLTDSIRRPDQHQSARLEQGSAHAKERKRVQRMFDDVVQHDQVVWGIIKTFSD